MKDLSLEMNIFILLEPGALRSSVAREENAGSRDWKGPWGLWALHVYFTWAWPLRCHHCVPFSVNTSRFHPERSRRDNKQENSLCKFRGL